MQRGFMSFAFQSRLLLPSLVSARNHAIHDMPVWQRLFARQKQAAKCHHSLHVLYEGIYHSFWRDVLLFDNKLPRYMKTTLAILQDKLLSLAYPPLF
jgi:hypothetical protein